MQSWNAGLDDLFRLQKLPEIDGLGNVKNSCSGNTIVTLAHHLH